MAKLNFQQLIQSSVSHDSSELILIICFAAYETFNSAQFFCRNIYIYLWQRKKKSLKLFPPKAKAYRGKSGHFKPLDPKIALETGSSHANEP